MALPKFEDDVNIIQTLDNEPNATQGYTPLQVKILFDKAANLIKTWINDVLTPAQDAKNTTYDAHLVDVTPHGIERNLANNGYIKLPGGVIIQWGKVTSNATPGDGTTSNLNVAFPTAFVSIIVSADATVTGGAVTVQARALNLSQFIHYSTAASQQMYYIAIGY